jgi:hypothetical protein
MRSTTGASAHGAYTHAGGVSHAAEYAGASRAIDHGREQRRRMPEAARHSSRRLARAKRMRSITGRERARACAAGRTWLDMVGLFPSGRETLSASRSPTMSVESDHFPYFRRKTRYVARPPWAFLPSRSTRSAAIWPRIVRSLFPIACAVIRAPFGSAPSTASSKACR